MDDLLGEDWKAPVKPTTTAPAAFASNYGGFRASPQPQPSSTVLSPQILSRPSSTVNGTAATKPATGDAFGSILSLKSQKASSTLSIQARQKQLLEEKRRQQEQHAQLWDTLGSGRGTPEVRTSSPAVAVQGDEDDVLTAFNAAAAAPVDKASYYPPPGSAMASRSGTPAEIQGGLGGGGFDEDDDPFGLGGMARAGNGNGHDVAPARHYDVEEDDILGDLGKPVTARTPERAPSDAVAQADEVFGQMHASAASEGIDNEPQDQSLAELVEMGFPADTAKIALAENGGNVQGAVGWLLQQAHEESKQKAKANAQTRRRSPTTESKSPPRRPRGNHDATPAWMRQEPRTGSATDTKRQDSRSPANGEKDSALVAQELGNKLFKGANSLWKASQKQMAKTMAEFQQERDPQQPKWMQDASAESSRASSQRRQEERTVPRKSAVPVAPTIDVTDEAALLDMPRDERPAKPSRSAVSELPVESPSRGRSPRDSLPHQPPSRPTFTQQQSLPQKDKRPATKLSRQDVEDQSAQAYVSPSRRKRPTPKPEPQQEPEVDLFSPAPEVKPASAPTPALSIPLSRAAQGPRTSQPSAAPSKASTPPRAIPSVSPSALSNSAQRRKAGTEAFKRGDYAAAHDHYTAALTPLPATHPILIIALCNRALTALKTGDAKTAVSDADRALVIIGPSQGMGESVDLGTGEGLKEMRDFYGKALTRKAEALEHLEKWADAAAVWRLAVEGGVGGANSARARNRCEKAAAPATTKPAAAVTPAKPGPGRKAPPPARSLGNSLARPALGTPVSADAVNALRAANAAAERQDDEKFALTDQVDARLTAWRGGKADNLRALLQSLDTVLWADAGWKKVGMSDLVMPNKVKIVYMKAIGKVHPDKIPLNATTEQRMVSAAVFSTLNEAWDKFKRDNGL